MPHTPPLKSETPLRVAVVDDEDSLRRVLERVLALHGHRAEGFESGSHFLSRWTQDRAFDVILLDICMPGLSGIEVFNTLSAAPEPHPRVVIISGWDCTGRLHELLRDKRVDFLQKPFRVDAMLSLIQKSAL
ncbi:MAG: hypothetical protein CVU59_04170 [Deltaproteobacteria bacterium HGW-Deltaproteobacteria-17]|nr:MAG: hypothetical protein CVU59_04170 [Deltaproteobacteria bacterium HGW-Deltaproteobacteria-17]